MVHLYGFPFAGGESSNTRAFPPFANRFHTLASQVRRNIDILPDIGSVTLSPRWTLHGLLSFPNWSLEARPVKLLRFLSGLRVQYPGHLESVSVTSNTAASVQLNIKLVMVAFTLVAKFDILGRPRTGMFTVGT